MSTRLSGTARRNQIIQVATAVFAHHGFQGTTTKTIARHAGINEALLFRHFRNKETLYRSIIDELSSARRPSRQMDEIFKRGGNDLEIFTELACNFLSKSANDQNLTRLLWFTALEGHPRSNLLFDTYMNAYCAPLARYIQRRKRQKDFRKVDSLLAARGFLGMLASYVLTGDLFGAEGYNEIRTKEVSAKLARIWLMGLQNESQEPVRSRNTRSASHATA